MKIILQESIESLGSIGDIVNVKDGYARNYLFPRAKAVEATPGELVKLEKRRVKIEKAKLQELESAKALAVKLKEISVSRMMRVSEEGHLYGSVGVADVSDLLKEQGHEVEKKQVLLSEPIKSLGTFTVPIRLHPEVTVDIQVVVMEDKSEK